MELPIRPVDYANLWEKLQEADLKEWVRRQFDDGAEQQWELIAGRLVPVSHSDLFHHKVTFSLIAWTIGDRLAARPGDERWALAENVFLKLDDHVIAADLVGWRETDDPPTAESGFFSKTPDWVCLNKRHGYKDYLPISRETILRQAGVSFFWEVDVFGKSIAAFQLKRRRWIRAGKMMPRGKFKAKPFPELKFNPENLWR